MAEAVEGQGWRPRSPSAQSISSMATGPGTLSHARPPAAPSQWSVICFPHSTVASINEEAFLLCSPLGSPVQHRAWHGKLLLTECTVPS